jgi:hypothetical protein
MALYFQLPRLPFRVTSSPFALTLNPRSTQYLPHSGVNTFRRRDVARDTQQQMDPLRQGAFYCSPAASVSLLRQSRMDDAFDIEFHTLTGHLTHGILS